MSLISITIDPSTFEVEAESTQDALKQVCWFFGDLTDGKPPRVDLPIHVTVTNPDEPAPVAETDEAAEGTEPAPEG